MFYSSRGFSISHIVFSCKVAIRCDPKSILMFRSSSVFSVCLSAAMGRVQTEKLKLFSQSDASAASPKKRTQPSIDDLMNSTPKSKQSKQKFDANLDMLVLHYCDEAAAYGVEF